MIQLHMCATVNISREGQHSLHTHTHRYVCVTGCVPVFQAGMRSSSNSDAFVCQFISVCIIYTIYMYVCMYVCADALLHCDYVYENEDCIESCLVLRSKV